MNTVTIEIPEAFTHQLGSTAEEVARNARIELSLQMYREGKWSTGKAAEFAQFYIGDFLELLRARRISREYTEKMLNQDFAYARGGL